MFPFPIHTRLQAYGTFYSSVIFIVMGKVHPHVHRLITLHNIKLSWHLLLVLFKKNWWHFSVLSEWFEICVRKNHCSLKGSHLCYLRVSHGNPATISDSSSHSPVSALESVVNTGFAARCGSSVPSTQQEEDWFKFEDTKCC